MIEVIKIILLGIIEGVTEFLPISSTGHLIVGVALLQPALSANSAESFEIFIQFGAVVAVIAYYWRDLTAQAHRIPRDRETQRFWLAIVIAFIPAAVVGFFLREFIKDALFNPTVVAIALIVGGIVLIVVEKLPYVQSHASGAADLRQITLPKALIIGFAQTVALIPGTSRSAASIIGGLGCGLNRATATTFSFYLAIPTLGIATLADFVLSFGELQPGDLPYFLLGAVVAGIAAWFSIRWLLNYVSTHSYIPFGIYRIVAGLVILLMVATSIL